MLSLFGPKHCKRCSGELAEVEKKLALLKAENEQLRQTLAAIQSSQIPVSTSEIAYIASWNRTHFHRPNCVWMEKLPKDKLREFSSHEEAVKAGYRPCKTCCA